MKKIPPNPVRAARKTAAKRPRTDTVPRGTVPAVARAVRLLDALASSPGAANLGSLAAQLALPKSTVHGLCATLVQTGLVTRFDDGSYRLGPHIMDLAHAFLQRTDLGAEFMRLGDSPEVLPEETLILSVLDGADVVYVGCRNGTRPLALNFRIGLRLPATCTASGKAMLSTLAPERIKALVDQAGLRTLTRKRISGMRALTKQLAQARASGYAVDDEETGEGMICFGAPVFDARGAEAVAGIGVSLLKASTTARQRAQAAEAVRRLAVQLSRCLGARGHGPV